MSKELNLKIVADEKIPFVKDAFSSLGECRLFPGRSIKSEHLKRADLLLVRSVTPVNQDLLKGTSVKMVASATIGFDHIDLDYLTGHQIQFAHSPGGNAKSVAEYVMVAILEFTLKNGKALEDLSLGVVGIGNIGSIVVEMGMGLGLTVLKNDPLLAENSGDNSYFPLDKILQCDIITLHVPLTKSGRHKTHHLFDEATINKLQPSALLINTSRGPVVDNLALKEALINQRISAAVLDVWENEPNIDLELLNHVFIATPHVAGYSLDGKANCTNLVYQKVCEFFGLEPTWIVKDSLPEIGNSIIEINNTDTSDVESLHQIMENIYSIKQDNLRMRSSLFESQNNAANEFDRLRNNYPIRREFWNYHVSVPESSSLMSKLHALGFWTRY